MKLLVTMPEGELRDSFLDENSKKLLKDNFEVFYNTGTKNYTAEELKSVAEDMDVLVTGWGTPSLKKAGLTEKGTKLKIVAHTGGSVGDLIDNTAYESGIKILSGNSMYASSTAEGALCYILAGLRYFADDVYGMHKGDYWVSPKKTRGLIGKTVGIIGVGAVARELIKLLEPFNVNLLLWDRYDIGGKYTQCDLDYLLESSDVVTVHLGLNESTKGFIGERELKKIKDGALFVNTSRGAVIDECALVSELTRKRFDAVLDVFEKEPLPVQSPLRQMENVYLIPHRAGPAVDMRRLIGYNICDGAVKVKNGMRSVYEIDAVQASRMTRH